jgi:mono/diheme cytochrome c family protein
MKHLILLTAALLFSTNGFAQEAVARGNALFETWCTPCHAPGDGGAWGSATEFLEKKYNGQLPGSIEERTDFSPEFIKTILRTATPRMSAFRPTELSDADLEDLAAYLTRNN